MTFLLIVGYVIGLSFAIYEIAAHTDEKKRQSTFKLSSWQFTEKPNISDNALIFIKFRLVAGSIIFPLLWFNIYKDSPDRLLFTMSTYILIAVSIAALIFTLIDQSKSKPDPNSVTDKYRAPSIILLLLVLIGITFLNRGPILLADSTRIEKVKPYSDPSEGLLLSDTSEGSGNMAQLLSKTRLFQTKTTAPDRIDIVGDKAIRVNYLIEDTSCNIHKETIVEETNDSIYVSINLAPIGRLASPFSAGCSSVTTVDRLDGKKVHRYETIELTKPINNRKIIRGEKK